MVLSTQVAARDRQSASLYPFPLTPLLGLLNFASAGIVAGILADFVYELHGESMSVPSELSVALAAAVITVTEQIASFVRQKLSVFPAKLNLGLHVVLALFWLAACALLTYRLEVMVLRHTCTLAVWKTDMGLMVCRMYKAIYAFSIVCLATSSAAAFLDWKVLREGSAGVYRPLTDQSPYVGMNKTPEIGQDKSPMLPEFGQVKSPMLSAEK